MSAQSSAGGWWSAGRESGQAAVEMSLLMIVFVPLTLFIFFAQDAVAHLLDIQEGVISTTWDQTTRPRQRSVDRANARDVLESAANINRVHYADHDSSYINEGRIDAVGGWPGFSDAGHKYHHTQPFGHVCWCQGPGDCKTDDPYTNPGVATQLSCDIVGNAGAERYGMAAAGLNWFKNNLSEGGVASCWGKGWMFNYLIGETFLAGFGRVNDVKLFNKKYRTGDAHRNGGDGTADLLLKDRAAILVDSWGLGVGDPVQVDEQGGIITWGSGLSGIKTANNAYYAKAKKVFTAPAWYLAVAGACAAYSGSAMSNMVAAVGIDPTGSPNTGFGMLGIPNSAGFWMVANFEAPDAANTGDYQRTIPGLFGDSTFMTTPLFDELLNSYNARGKYYLGATNSEGK